MSQQIFFLESFNTPTGRMLLATDAERRVCAADWQDKEQRMLGLIKRYYGADKIQLREVSQMSPARRALSAYFEGDLHAIDEQPTAVAGTDFQRSVWAALRGIPAGYPISYSGLAQLIGRPNACRAVGLANGANPISIFVPCHRVIGANAALTGYGGGIERKRWLLEHEGKAFDKSAAPQPIQYSLDQLS